MKKTLFLFATLSVTGCGTVEKMNRLVNESTCSINANADAIERSTEAVRRNAALVDASNRAIEENRRLLESEMH